MATWLRRTWDEARRSDGVASRSRTDEDERRTSGMEDALRFPYVDQTRRGGRSKDRLSTRTRGRATRRGLVERRSTPTRRPGTDANDKQQCEWQTTCRKGRFAMMLGRGTDPLGPRHPPPRLVPRATCTLSCSFLASFLPRRASFAPRARSFDAIARGCRDFDRRRRCRRLGILEPVSFRVRWEGRSVSKGEA